MIAGSLYLRQYVSRQQYRTIVSDLFNQFSDFEDLIRVQTVGRFVENHEFRVVDDRLSNAYAVVDNRPTGFFNKRLLK